MYTMRAAAVSRQTDGGDANVRIHFYYKLQSPASQEMEGGMRIVLQYFVFFVPCNGLIVRFLSVWVDFLPYSSAIMPRKGEWIMLEITFSQNAYGSLQQACTMKRGQKMIGGACSVLCSDPEEAGRITAEMKKVRQWWGGETGSQPGDVVCLPLYLEYGNISELKWNVQTRREALEELLGCYEGVVDDLLGEAQSALLRIGRADKMRMWIGEQNAGDIAAAMYLCSLLRGKDVCISAVYLPMETQEAAPNPWEDETAVQMSLLADKACVLTPQMRERMAQRFEALQQENAPLRAMVNGRLLGVDENIFDRTLLGEIPQGDFVPARVIGRTLGKTRGVSDMMLFRRLCRWKSEGIFEEIEPARDDEAPYSGVWRRVR